MEVDDREAERLVSLQEAISDLGSCAGDPRAEPARCRLAVQAVPGQSLSELAEQPARGLDALVERDLGLPVADSLAQPAPAADELLREDEQLAVAAVLGWV